MLPDLFYIYLKYNGNFRVWTEFLINLKKKKRIRTRIWKELLCNTFQNMEIDYIEVVL